MKYTSTNIENTKACKKPTKSSKNTTTNGNKSGIFIKDIVALTINPKSTIPAKIFQNNLSDNERTLDISPTSSMSPKNNPMMMSNIFQMKDQTPVTLCTMPSPYILHIFLYNGIRLF